MSMVPIIEAIFRGQMLPWVMPSEALPDEFLRIWRPQAWEARQSARAGTAAAIKPSIVAPAVFEGQNSSAMSGPSIFSAPSVDEVIGTAIAQPVAQQEALIPAALPPASVDRIIQRSLTGGSGASIFGDEDEENEAF